MELNQHLVPSHSTEKMYLPSKFILLILLESTKTCNCNDYGALLQAFERSTFTDITHNYKKLNREKNHIISSDNNPKPNIR